MLCISSKKNITKSKKSLRLLCRRFLRSSIPKDRIIRTLCEIIIDNNGGASSSSSTGLIDVDVLRLLSTGLNLPFKKTYVHHHHRAQHTAQMNHVDRPTAPTDKQSWMQGSPPFSYAGAGSELIFQFIASLKQLCNCNQNNGQRKSKPQQAPGRSDGTRQQTHVLASRQCCRLRRFHRSN